MLKVVESKPNLELMFEWAILSSSIIFIFIGFGGLIIVITTHRYQSDILLQYSYAFVYCYMLVLGILLLV